MLIVATNRSAKHEYEIISTIEAGVSLLGEEVKSIRKNSISLKESYIGSVHDELFLINAHIAKYFYSKNTHYDPIRKKKLLLHKKQINKIIGNTNKKSLTCIPLKAYFNNKNLFKIQIAIAKGKKLYDKRKALKEKSIKKDQRYEK